MMGCPAGLRIVRVDQVLIASGHYAYYRKWEDGRQVVDLLGHALPQTVVEAGPEFDALSRMVDWWLKEIEPFGKIEVDIDPSKPCAKETPTPPIANGMVQASQRRNRKHVSRPAR